VEGIFKLTTIAESFELKKDRKLLLPDQVEPSAA